MCVTGDNITVRCTDLVEEDVGRLDVAVQDGAGAAVAVLEGHDELRQHAPDEGLFDPPPLPPARLDEPPQVPALGSMNG